MTNLFSQGKIIRQFWGKIIRQSTSTVLHFVCSKEVKMLQNIYLGGGYLKKSLIPLNNNAIKYDDFIRE